MCDRCDHVEWLDEIEDMLDDSVYEFASNTLVSMKEWITDKGHVTDKQIIAIENIRDSVRKD